jgi:hypothetical protein
MTKKTAGAPRKADDQKWPSRYIKVNFQVSHLMKRFMKESGKKPSALLDEIFTESKQFKKWKQSNTERLN